MRWLMNFLWWRWLIIALVARLPLNLANWLGYHSGLVFLLEDFYRREQDVEGVQSVRETIRQYEAAAACRR